jgi:hypothetical protein
MLSAESGSVEASGLGSDDSDSDSVGVGVGVLVSCWLVEGDSLSLPLLSAVAKIENATKATNTMNQVRW